MLIATSDQKLTQRLQWLSQTAGRYDAGGKIVSFVFCNGLRRKQVFHKYQTLEFDPVRLQIFARQSRKKPVTLTEQRQQARDDLANSFLWLKHQGGTRVQSVQLPGCCCCMYHCGFTHSYKLWFGITPARRTPCSHNASHGEYHDDVVHFWHSDESVQHGS